MATVEYALSPEEIDALLSVDRADDRLLPDVQASFAGRFSASLTTLLRSAVEVTPRSVEHATCGEFVASLAAPACLAVATMDPLPGRVALEVGANLLHRAIDRLLGGSGLLPVRLHEFSAFELVLIERIAARAMDDLHEAWGPGAFGFHVEHVAPAPALVRLAGVDERVTVVTFAMEIGGERGHLRLAFARLDAVGRAGVSRLGRRGAWRYSE
jgi:flagellar motor switch protein FliM